MEAQSPTNEELLARYQRADFSGFDLFYRRNQDLIIGYLRLRLGNRAEADDAFQETFLRVHRAILTYDPTQSALAWVFTIARNAAIDLVRKRRHSSEIDSSTVPTAPLAEASIIARQQLAQVFGRLAPEECAMLMDRFWEDDSFSDIARRQGITEVNARQKLSRLLRKLKANSSP